MVGHCNLCGRAIKGKRLHCAECVKWLEGQSKKTSRRQYESFNSANAALLKDISDIDKYNKQHKTKLSYGQYKAIM